MARYRKSQRLGPVVRRLPSRDQPATLRNPRSLAVSPPRSILTGIVFLTLAALPSVASARVGPRCHTVEWRQLASQSSFAPPPANWRPSDVGHVDSDLYPLRIHYLRAGDAERAESVILPIAEESWRIEVEEMGWPAPPSDGTLGGDSRYDMYMTNDGTYGGAYTYGSGGDTNPRDGWYSLASYIALDQGGISDADMPDFISHEFNHALQYTIDGHEITGFVWESTAEAMEELVYPETDLYQLDIVDFQELPFASLLFDGYSDEVMAYDDYSYYEYGGSIVGLYIEQRFGTSDGTKLLELWEALAQGDGSNEPDYVDALDTVGGDVMPDHGALYLDFAAWRMFAGPYDDGAHFHEGGEWGREGIVALEDSANLTDLDGATLRPNDPPYDLGTSYWLFEVDEGSTKTLRLELTSADAIEWGLVASAWLGAGPARVVQARGGTEGAPVTLDLDLTGATRVMIGGAALGRIDMDAEGRHDRRDFTINATFVDGGPDDTGDTGAGDTGDTDGVDSGGPAGEKGEGRTGCGCAADPSSAVGGLALLLAAATGAARRRSRG